MGAFQPWHLIVILVIVLLVFGPGKLPELGKALGDGMRELKRATTEGDHGAAAAGIPANRTPVQTLPQPVTVPAPVAPSVAGRTCPSCRAAVPVADRFCGTCGTTSGVAQPVQVA